MSKVNTRKIRITSHYSISLLNRVAFFFIYLLLLLLCLFRLKKSYTLSGCNSYTVHVIRLKGTIFSGLVAHSYPSILEAVAVDLCDFKSSLVL